MSRRRQKTVSLREPERKLDLLGVGAVARFERAMRNRRDPTWQAESGEDRAYKEKSEIVRSREGVRGARSTEEVVDNTMEGRGPALVKRAVEVSARAWI